jgi:hypothetical protein
MADVTIKPAFTSALPDDAAYTGFVQPSHWNAARVFSLGTQYDLLQRDTGSATGASYTNAPHVTMLVFPGTTDPATLPNCGFVAVDDGVTATLYYRASTGALVPMLSIPI